MRLYHPTPSFLLTLSGEDCQGHGGAAGGEGYVRTGGR